MGSISTSTFDDQGPSKDNSNFSADCLELLNLVLDEEASVGQRQFFFEHLKGCMPCNEKFSIDMAIKKMIKERCGKNVPEGLMETIRAKVLQSADQHE